MASIIFRIVKSIPEEFTVEVISAFNPLAHCETCFNMRFVVTHLKNASIVTTEEKILTQSDRYPQMSYIFYNHLSLFEIEHI